MRSCIYVYFHLNCAPTKRTTETPDWIGRYSLAGLSSRLNQHLLLFNFEISSERMPGGKLWVLPVRSVRERQFGFRIVLPLSP